MKPKMNSGNTPQEASNACSKDAGNSSSSGQTGAGQSLAGELILVQQAARGGDVVEDDRAAS